MTSNPTATRRRRAPRQATRKPLRGAIILLASLYWEGNRSSDGEEGDKRRQWRKAQLNRSTIRDLRGVAIRYGRKSDVARRRKGQFTMVFAGRKPGTAKIANVRADLMVVSGSIPLSTEELIRVEADELAKAEDIQSAARPTHACSWGVAAMAINPASPYSRSLRAIWRRQFKPEADFNHRIFGRGIVDQHGFLTARLPWKSSALRRVDFCLATQTKPDDFLPKAKAIAEAARAFGKNSYFARTVAAGIMTGDDEAIRRHLDRGGGSRRVSHP